LGDRLFSVYYDIINQLKEITSEKSFKIAVFVDDLDRCLPEKAIELLEAIKLFLDLEGYLFVIGVDKDVVEKGIAYHYRHLDYKKDDSVTVKSKDYLDKLIQFPLDLPPVEYGYKSGYIKSLLGGNKPYEVLAGLIEKGVGDNPRELKRFINLLAFMSWQADTIKKDILAVETDEDNKRLIEAHFIPVIYVKWSLIVFKFPDEYNDIKANRHLLIVMQNIATGKAKEEDRKATKSMSPKLIEILKEGKEFPDDDWFLAKLIHLVQAVRVETAAEKMEIRHPKETEYKLGDMVRIYKGSFLYGEDKREINIGDDYYMDAFPVTNKQYQEFINDNKEYKVPYLEEEWAKPYNWDLNKRTFPPDKDNLPVVSVSYKDAVEFCKWRTQKDKLSEEEKYRLPTEEEWEKAARGNDGWEYPWGNEFDKEKCNSKESGNSSTTEVIRYPAGVSPYGCQDMAGNVWEWTDSWYDENKSSKVVRGGSWFYEAYFCRCASRTWFRLDKRSHDVGFRCARTLKD
jgi:formylglycine-generating enzyme required for sulfatase activity